jgi:DNA-binding CsgD family transcriptional regulator
MMEQSPLPIELIEPDGRITEVNSAWRRMWNLSEEKAIEFLCRYNMLQDAQADKLGLGLLIRKAFAGEPVVLPPVEYSAHLAFDQIGLEYLTDAKPWIQCYLYPIKDKHDEVVKVVNTYVDMTSLRQEEERARKIQPELQDIFRAALDRDVADGAIKVEEADILNKLGALTPREREIMIHVIAGKPNKTISDDLDIALVTVKVHRGQMMKKLGLTSVAELVHLCDLAGISPTL